MNSINQNKHIEETDKPKQRSSVISDLELEVIYDRVLYKIDFFHDLNCHATIWDDCIPYLERLVKHPRPDLYVSKIKNDLREIREDRKPNNWPFRVKKTDIISAQLYIILYYLYRDNQTYTDIILPSLVEIFGYFKDSRNKEFEHIQKLLKNLPECKAPIYTQDAAVDNKLLQEKDETITNLRKEIVNLSTENVQLREELEKKEQQDEPDEETTSIKRGSGKNAQEHIMTAKKAVDIIKKHNKLLIMPKKEWEDILSELTGLSKNTIHNHI